MEEGPLCSLFSRLVLPLEAVMEPRWKGKNAETKALADPMSKIVERLQSSLRKSDAQGLLLDSVVLLPVDHEQIEVIELLNRSFFGRPRPNSYEHKQWYELDFEEAFYLCYSLECLKIMDENKCLVVNNDLWKYMKSKSKAFPESYIAYSHLRNKDWVVKDGSKYGADFVAYRHHPSLVHSEFAVILEFDKSHRLRVLSDVKCVVRICASVAKTLLVLRINTKDCDFVSPPELDLYKVEEMIPEQHHEDLHIRKRLISTQEIPTLPTKDISTVSVPASSISRIQPKKAPLSRRTGPRWKGKKSAEAKALADPMSKIVEQLQSSLHKSETQGFLLSSAFLLSVDVEQIELLEHSCFGQPISSEEALRKLLISSDEDKQWYELSFEEAFYLCYSLECVRIMDENKCLVSNNDVWQYMKSKRRAFPEFYIAYSHLRKKNWVVRSGLQYGADFVAYCHHPSLVHSEFVVIVDFNNSSRLRVWSDIEGMVRLCTLVAKTLMVLSVNTNDCDVVSPSELGLYKVEGRTITRWFAEKHREDPRTSERLSSA
ncbi:hypothetical protein C5167_010055 [Papaver somniferum]|uniref:tRNA-intron lyase n=1 Tax=Papaver somniferum TaxID=3469 RepID=A0A4Y7K348_PAPSO|nr:uncharacterized protein LOC113288599 isoform X1 [Papaver somniferum]RZC66368.1 hypothetical protein C5167_010055 [Papaver somniferum]